ncbi:MAG: hypothetical protein WC389_10985 [Lutibacter sp.]
MADAGSEFAKELLRRKEQREKPVKKVNIETVKEQIEVRSDEEIVNDITTPIDEFFAAATRLERKKDEFVQQNNTNGESDARPTVVVPAEPNFGC